MVQVKIMGAEENPRLTFHIHNIFRIMGTVVSVLLFCMASISHASTSHIIIITIRTCSVSPWNNELMDILWICGILEVVFLSFPCTPKYGAMQRKWERP